MFKIFGAASVEWEPFSNMMPMHPVALGSQSKSSSHHSFLHQRRHSFRDITTSRIHQQQRIPLLHHSAKSPPPLLHKSSVARWKTQPSRHPGVHEAIFFADRNNFIFYYYKASEYFFNLNLYIQVNF